MKRLLSSLALAAIIAAGAPASARTPAAAPAPAGGPIIPPADPAAAKPAPGPAAAPPAPGAAAAVTATATRHDRPMRHRQAWHRYARHRYGWYRRHARFNYWWRGPRSDRVAEVLNTEELRRVAPPQPMAAPAPR